ncbi:MAG: hypothetical protein WCB12_04490 [Bryobacteraceae bacterium]
MPKRIEIRVHVPGDLGLTKTQMASLKKKLKVEIVASTLPVQGLIAQTQQQVVIRAVDRPPVNR